MGFGSAQRARPRTPALPFAAFFAVRTTLRTAPFDFASAPFAFARTAGAERAARAGAAGARSRTGRGAGARVETGGRVTAPSAADETSAAYFAKTPSV